VRKHQRNLRAKNFVGVSCLNTNCKLLEARSQLPAANEILIILIQTMCGKICEYQRNLRAKHAVVVACLNTNGKLLEARSQLPAANEILQILIQTLCGRRHAEERSIFKRCGNICKICGQMLMVSFR